MVWYDTFNDVFFISIATIISGFCGLAIRYCFKSKCENVSFCFGLIKVSRNVLIEEEIEIGDSKSDEEQSNKNNSDKGIKTNRDIKI